MAIDLGLSGSSRDAGTSSRWPSGNASSPRRGRRGSVRFRSRTRGRGTPEEKIARLEQENAQLRKENASLQMDRAILEGAAAFVAGESDEARVHSRGEGLSSLVALMWGSTATRSARPYSGLRRREGVPRHARDLHQAALAVVSPGARVACILPLSQVDLRLDVSATRVLLILWLAIDTLIGSSAVGDASKPRSECRGPDGLPARQPERVPDNDLDGGFLSRLVARRRKTSRSSRRRERSERSPSAAGSNRARRPRAEFGCRKRMHCASLRPKTYSIGPCSVRPSALSGM